VSGTKWQCAVLHQSEGTKRFLLLDEMLVGGWGFIAMLNHVYFVRQIRTMLKFAQLTSDARFAAFLIEKANHLRSQIEEVPAARDVGPRAPDVEPDTTSPPSAAFFNPGLRSAESPPRSSDE
jgi:hypothetical protein